MRDKLIGSIVLATEQGLGYLAKDFYDSGLIDRVYVQTHTTRKNHYEWYPDRGSKEELLECDVLLFFETPFDYELVKKAREKGIKTVLMVMYECTNIKLSYLFDLILTPSDLDQQYYPQGKRVTVPNPDWIRWKLREKAEVFVHNAGNGGLGGRNGTKELLEAMKYVKSPIKLVVRSQVPIKEYDDPRIEYQFNVDRKDLWNEGDVFIFPEKFNGLSLPIQEAYASGMAVMCGDRFPMNTWLPKELLIPVSDYKTESISVEFQSAVFEPKVIAECIDNWYNKDITKYSVLGKNWADKNSWTIQREIYENLLK